MGGIGFALIGCGKIGGKHAKILPALPDVALLYACDPTRSRAEELAASVPGCTATTDIGRAIGDPRVQAVAICTPSGTHADLGMQAARAGKHVIIEKPLALRLDEADRLIETCDRRGVKLFVVQQNRYNRPVQALRRALESDRLGHIFLGTVRVLWHRTQDYYNEEAWRGTWAQDGGVLTNQASHHIDLLIWMMGDVDSVFARGRTVLHHIETEDTGVVLMRFRNGGYGVVEATTCAQPRDLEGSLALYGEGGTVEIGGFSANDLKTWSFKDPRPEDASVFEDHGKNPSEFGYNHRAFYLDAIATLQSDRRGLLDGIEGRRSLEVINAIYESIETGQEVFLRFEPKRCKLGVPEGRRR
ncbi:MAG: Gfo/Idh/MocA family oxidoreductase [Candidatus Eisenbacteria bacterium]|nr:Gfo/Idh/MocA family oxidoreductase [Candidatus Eisenbacteria bacterium]